MAEDQFHFNVNRKTLAKMLENIVADNIVNKKLMVDYLTRVIMKGNNGHNFLMALTDTFPQILFKPGDKVRILRKNLWYAMDDEKSREAGHIEGDGIYIVINKVNTTDLDCYSGVLTFIDSHGNQAIRELDFNHDVIMMDNTVKVCTPASLPGDII
jgi:hypothetical protein